MKLDVACGNNKKEGFTGVDIAPIESVDIVHDLTVYPWPFEDNSIEEIWCCHYIEHVQDIMSFMNELYRILIPDGKATIVSPYYSSIRAWQDPTHVRAISEATYLYYDKEWRDANKLSHYPITANFKVLNWGHYWNPNWINRSHDAKNFAIMHYSNVVDDLQATLIKV